MFLKHKSSEYNCHNHLPTLNSLVTTHLAEDGKGLGRYHVTKNRSVNRTSHVKIHGHNNTRRKSFWRQLQKRT